LELNPAVYSALFDCLENAGIKPIKSRIFVISIKGYLADYVSGYPTYNVLV